MKVKMLLKLFFATIVTQLLVSCSQPFVAHGVPNAGTSEANSEDYTDFEVELEELRQAFKIPGMSAAIVKDQELVWAKGFGYVDLDNQIKATPDTPYHLASLTKPFAAVIVMQLVEEGLINLDDPVSDYGVFLDSPGVIRVRHLLTHTSDGEPGVQFSYNGWRYLYLDHIIQVVTRKSFRELLDERVLIPLEMDNTVPNPISKGEGHLIPFSILLNPKNQHVYRNMARPYYLDSSYNLVEGQYEELFWPGAGLISTVIDMAKFHIALDQNVLVSQETKEQMFAPTVSKNGVELPHGLGWFTQIHNGVRLIWHYGWWPPCASAFILHVPDENLTFIILATTDNLSRPYQLGSGNFLPLDSAVGVVFYKTFIHEPKNNVSIPHVDWKEKVDVIIEKLGAVTNPDVQEILERELISRRRLYDSVGQMEQSERLKTVHSQVYAPSRLENYADLQSIGNPPVKFEAPHTMYHRVAILCLALIILSAPLLWWIIRRGIKGEDHDV